MTAKKQNRWRRLLRSAANLLKTKGWCRVSKAKAEDGYPCSALDPNANQFCLIGSLIRANKAQPVGYYGAGVSSGDKAENRTYFEALKHLAKHPRIQQHAEYDSLGFWQFNDREARSAEDVIQVLLETANG